MHEKLKSWLADDTMYIAILLVMVGIASFGLGRLSTSQGGQASLNNLPKVQLLATSSVLVPKLPASSTPVSTANAAAIITATPTQKAVITGPYVGSKSGTKYYLTTCSGVKRIKETNKVFFTSVQDAHAAGYSPASNCPGL